MSQHPIDLFVAVPGGRVHVRNWMPDDQDAAQRIPMLLLHDSLGCVETWRSFPAALCDRLARRIIAYDRLGFGLSSAREALPAASFIADEAMIQVPALLDALGVGRFIAFGHSVGGGMALLCGARLPARCHAIVTEAAQTSVDDRTLQGISRAAREFAAPGALARLERYHGDKAAWVLRAWTQVWLSEAFRGWSLEHELAQVRCPVLAIHGDRDEFGPARFPDTIAAQAGGGAQKLLIADCGHVPHREKPDVLLEAVERFLR